MDHEIQKVLTTHIQPFVNLLTVIPISLESDEIDYFVGLLVDLVDQPNAIIQNMKGKINKIKIYTFILQEQ